MDKAGQAQKWRWLALAVTVGGIIVFSLPWIPSDIKFLLALPLYAAFVYVYYKYLCLKKSMVSEKEQHVEQKKTDRNYSRKPEERTDKVNKKKRN
ncbi:MAG: hypothetical protein PHO01_05600 [Desulfotomaculaceae bacterium]|nr:hypothetical protein [Desulfotomaculaceae bacterium]